MSNEWWISGPIENERIEPDPDVEREKWLEDRTEPCPVCGGKKLVVMPPCATCAGRGYVVKEK